MDEAVFPESEDSETVISEQMSSLKSLNDRTPSQTCCSDELPKANQIMNGKDSSPSTSQPTLHSTTARGRPSSLAHRETSQYQLVFGVDDTGSDASLTGSPLLHNSANQVVGYFSPQHEDGQTAPDGVSTSREERDSQGKQNNTISSLTEDRTSNLESNEVITSDSTPIGGETTVSTGPSDPAQVNGKESTDSDSSSTNSPRSCDKNIDQDNATNIPPVHGIVTSRPRSSSHSPDPEVKLEDVALRSRSTSPEDYGQKVHPLSLLTSSNSEVEDTPLSPTSSIPPYSPVLNTSGDEDLSPSERRSVSSLPTPLTPLTPLSDEAPVMSVLFSGISYLGSSSVDAPISEIEANRKMNILKEQAAGTEPIPVVLSIPLTNHGNVILKDPKTDQPMATYTIKQILFCARGNAEVLLDCFCLNVKNRRSGMYQCHVFRCDIVDACERVFLAIGRAFTTKTYNQSHPPLVGDNIRQDFLVSLDIHEEDGKGVFSPVPMDKDCFKLRQNTRKKVTLSVSQPSSSTCSIIVTRCFGLLVSPGKGVKVTEMNLLDNMNPSPNPGPSFSVAGIWDTGVSFLAPLNEETPKSVRFQFLTVAADLILESVTEPVRFKREVKVHVSKGGMSYTIMNLNLTTKKKFGPMDQLLYTLKLKKSEESSNKQSMYVVEDLRPASELKETAVPVELNRVNEEVPGHTPSPTQRVRKQNSVRGKGGGDAMPPTKNQDDLEDSDNDDDDDDDVVMSGWGDVEGMREDLLKDWGDILERWNGKDRTRPSRVIKLCRKGIPRHLRCQVWQMLTGAAHDPQLAEAYRLLLSRESPAENVINWDIKRTYVGHGYFQEPANKEALYKISKAYSVYDEEVGYCQGFSFMAAVLLLQKMPEETAFSVLVKIMYNYGHRNLFKANFRDLHLMFYQLDRLMEEHLPDLFLHFQTNRIETHMYASQWFLTLYTAKFPLSIVFRILDVYLCERIGVIFQVALSLLKVARKDLMALDFEGILGYFRVALPKKFQTEEDCQLLFSTILSFKINDKKLSKLQKDYQSFLEQQAQLEDPVMRLERDNKQLRDTIHRLEQENDNLAEDLVGSKIKLRSEMDKLEERIDSLSKEARAHKTSNEAAQMLITELREELKQAKEEFQRVMMKLTEEKLQHEGAIAEYKQVFKRLDEGHQKQKEELNQELLEVKAKLGSNEETTDRPSSLSSEQRLRNLELELAQTKLALVESQCKNQELEHKVSELSSTKTRKWYDMDFGNKKK